MAAETKTTQPQAPKARKPPLADWPTIKILAPPAGRYSTQADEWVFAFCTQSISGRINERPPTVRAFSIRRVHPHEVTNRPGFPSHKVGPDGKALYPLPKEGQPAQLPRLLGGVAAPSHAGNSQDGVAATTTITPDKVNYWGEGWYFWTTGHYYGMQDKFYTMTKDLEKQRLYQKKQEDRVQVWDEYQEYLKRSTGVSLPQQPNKWWGPTVPPRPLPDFRNDALLLPLPPDLPPVWSRIDKLLQPTWKVLGMFKTSITSGDQLAFGQRVWQKAWTKEPFLLASRTIEETVQRWRERDADGGDGTKGSTR